MTSVGVLSGAIVIKDQFSKTFGKFGSGLGTVGKGAAGVAAGVAVMGTALAAATLKALDMADALDNQAAATQTGVESLQLYNMAAEQAGQSAGNITTGLQKLQRSIGDPTVQVEEAVAKLGTSVEQLKALAPEQQFELILQRLGDIPNEADKTSVAMNLLGKSGANLLALSGDALPKLNTKFRELGLILDADVIQKVDRAEENLDLLKRTVSAAFTNVGASIAQTEGFNVAVNSAANLVGVFSSSITGSDNAITQWVDGAIKLAVDNLRILILVGNEVIGFVSKMMATLSAATEVISSPIDAIKGNVDAWNNLSLQLDIIDQKTATTASNVQTGFAEAAEAAAELQTQNDHLTATYTEGIGPSVEEVIAKQERLNQMYAAGVVGLQGVELEALNWGTIMANQSEFVTESLEVPVGVLEGLPDSVGGIASATESAFTRMGVKTRTELSKIAQQAFTDFQTIQTSGEATAESLQEAWETYLEARGEAEGAANEVTKSGFVETLGAASSALGAFAAKSKVAAIAQAGIDAALAIIKVFATTAFPASIVAAASIAATTGIQIAKIKSAKTGFREGTPGLDFQNFGSGSQEDLHGREAVVPESGVGDFAGQVAAALAPMIKAMAGSGGGSTPILEIDGVKFGRLIEKGTKNGTIRVHVSSVKEF